MCIFRAIVISSIPDLTWNPDTYERNTTAAFENQYRCAEPICYARAEGLFVVDGIANGTKSAMAWCLIKELVTLIYSYPQPYNVSFFASRLPRAALARTWLTASTRSWTMLSRTVIAPGWLCNRC